jgi:hypothetical protein
MKDWLSLLLWIGTDPRLPVYAMDTVIPGRYRQSKLSVRENLDLLKKAKIDSKKDNILYLDKAGRSPEPEVIEHLLTSPPDPPSKSRWLDYKRMTSRVEPRNRIPSPKYQ